MIGRRAGCGSIFWAARHCSETSVISTTLVYANLGYQFSETQPLGLHVFNLLDTKASDMDYFYTSRLPGEPAAPVDPVGRTSASLSRGTRESGASVTAATSSSTAISTIKHSRDKLDGHGEAARLRVRQAARTDWRAQMGQHRGSRPLTNRTRRARHPRWAESVRTRTSMPSASFSMSCSSVAALPTRLNTRNKVRGLWEDADRSPSKCTTHQSSEAPRQRRRTAAACIRMVELDAPVPHRHESRSAAPVQEQVVRSRHRSFPEQQPLEAQPESLRYRLGEICAARPSLPQAPPPRCSHRSRSRGTYTVRLAHAQNEQRSPGRTRAAHPEKSPSTTRKSGRSGRQPHPWSRCSIAGLTQARTLNAEPGAGDYVTLAHL